MYEQFLSTFCTVVLPHGVVRSGLHRLLATALATMQLHGLSSRTVSVRASSCVPGLVDLTPGSDIAAAAAACEAFRLRYPGRVRGG